MQTSDRGRAALELEEGVVLRAYRDVAGIWTIGAGLTAASGVVKPVAGMVITSAAADVLMVQALGRYEGDVEIAMAQVAGSSVERPSQHAFDAGVSFHWNTGAISRASWVDIWKRRASNSAVTAALCLWSKSGVKVLPALKARRMREASMLLDGAYRLPERLTAPGPIFARWGLTLAADETRAVFDGLRKLGFDPGTGADLIRLDAVLNFQRAHGLTADGIIGRATLTTLQRAMDAKAKAVPVAGVITVAAIGAVNGATEALLTVPHSGPAVLAAGLIWGAAQVWTYRDALAGRIAASLPRLATYLRSR